MAPLERAARAINPFAWYPDCADPEAYQREAIKKARAVLQALRLEPAEQSVWRLYRLQIEGSGHADGESSRR